MDREIESFKVHTKNKEDVQQKVFNSTYSLWNNTNINKSRKMAKRAVTATKEFLKAAPLPTYEGDTYTVIPHEFVMNETAKNLAAQGFKVKQELYRCNMNAQIAQGIYHLDYADDPDMGMMFAWSNSYDKSMRFKCAIGGYVFVCMNGMVNGNMGAWGRKHTGAADEETIGTIQEQISKAKNYYKQLVYDKECMKDIMVSPTVRAQLVGRLYFEEDLLNSEQLTMIKHQMKSPKYDYNADAKSLWALYNHITLSLHKSHPKDWLDHQRLVHWFFTQEYGIQPLVLQEDAPNEVTEKIPEVIQITQPVQEPILEIEQPVQELVIEVKEEVIQEPVAAPTRNLVADIKQIETKVETKQIDLLDAIKEAENNSENNLNHL